MAPIDSIERFYAHAIALEREAAERYAEFATYFADRGEEVLAGLCCNLASMERDHLEALLRASRKLHLPIMDTRDYEWLDHEAPQGASRSLLQGAGSPERLLEIALHAEMCAFDFFAWTVRTTSNPRVRALAREMADEEQQHVDWVRRALEGLDARQREPAGHP